MRGKRIRWLALLVMLPNFQLRKGFHREQTRNYRQPPRNAFKSPTRYSVLQPTLPFELCQHSPLALPNVRHREGRCLGPSVSIIRPVFNWDVFPFRFTDVDLQVSSQRDLLCGRGGTAIPVSAAKSSPLRVVASSDASALTSRRLLVRQIAQERLYSVIKTFKARHSFESLDRLTIHGKPHSPINESTIQLAGSVTTRDRKDTVTHLQKSTFGANFLDVKYSSAIAASCSLIAVSSNSSLPVLRVFGVFLVQAIKIGHRTP